MFRRYIDDCPGAALLGDRVLATLPPSGGLTAGQIAAAVIPPADPDAVLGLLLGMERGGKAARVTDAARVRWVRPWPGRLA